MLKNISVRSKLFILLSFPLAAIIFLVCSSSVERYKEYLMAEAATDVVSLSAVSGNLIHELQKERGLSAGFINSKGSSFSGELGQQRKLTDAMLANLKEEVARFLDSDLGDLFGSSLNPLLDRLNSLGELRQRIDRGAIPAGEAIAEFSSIIGQLQKELEEMLEFCQGAEMSRQASGIIAFVDSKEFAGQERASLNAALTAGAFNKNLYRLWVERVALQEESFKVFLAHASPSVKREYSEKLMPLKEKVEAFRKQAFEDQDKPGLTGNPKEWFAASTEYIDAMHVVELGMTKEFEEIARTQASEALLQLYITLGAAAAVFFFTLLLAWRIIGNITTPLKLSVAFAQSVAAGKLDSELDLVRADEFGMLSKALQAMLASLREMIGKAESATESAREESEKARLAMEEAREARMAAEHARQEGMSAAAEQIGEVVKILSSVSQDISVQLEQSDRGAREQSRRLEAAATAMEEMNVAVLEVAQNSSSAASIAEQARTQAQQGSAKVNEVDKNIALVMGNTQELKESMGRLGMRVQDIDKVLNVISDIADQTNLLALNAAIEAARAGDAGRGFAVVADEVRKLAEKTMEATKEVAGVLSGIQKDTEHNIDIVDGTVRGISKTAELAKESGERLDEIVVLSDGTRDQIDSIATASAEQSATSEEINRSVDDVNRIAMETVEAMENSTQGMRTLLEQTQALEKLVVELRADETGSGQS